MMPTTQPNRSFQTAMNPSRALLQHTQNTLLRGHCEAGEIIDSYCPAAVHDLHAAKSDIRRVKPRVAVCPRLVVMTAVVPKRMLLPPLLFCYRCPSTCFSFTAWTPSQPKRATAIFIIPSAPRYHTPVRTRLYRIVSSAHDGLSVLSRFAADSKSKGPTRIFKVEDHSLTLCETSSAVLRS
jgi:hypothetical protein